MESGIILQVGVKIFLRNSGGQFLLLRRSLAKYPDVKGRWDIVGGRIEPGTALGANLEREVKEETGLSLSGEPELICAQDILRKPGYHIVRLTYVGDCAGEVKLDEEENDMHKWYTRQEIEKEADLDIYVKEILDKQLI